MYEVGKVYVWQNQVGAYAHFNGTECTPDEPAALYRHILTLEVRWAQHVVLADGNGWLAERGDLRPKTPPTGEKKIRSLFEPKPVMEVA